MRPLVGTVLVQGDCSFLDPREAWTPFSYTSVESLIASAWYPKTAYATLNLDSTQQAQDTYVLGYLCTWNGTAWKCGCRDLACTQRYCGARQSFSDGGADTAV